MTPEQALMVARFLFPDDEWVNGFAALCQSPQWAYGSNSGSMSLAAAERALVERGLAHEYGEALMCELREAKRNDVYPFVSTVDIRTASPEVIARAILRVVEGQEKP